MNSTMEYLKKIKRTVLVVDDEEINREILGGILEEQYEVLFAENGDSALKIVEEKTDTVSLVLLDLRMPGTDGFTVMDIMQADPVKKSIPIIVLTSDETAEIESLRRGASDFIKKPYDMPEKILARVGRIIDLFEERSIIRSTEKDELTGLLSMNYFYEYASITDKYKPGRDMDAVTVNINNFHLYNEMYGIHNGEKMLTVMAKVISDFASSNDGIAGKGDADNFFLYMPHMYDYDDLSRAIQKEFEKNNDVINIRFRIGVNHIKENTKRLDAQFSRARVASESISNASGSGIAYYSDEMASQRLFEEKLIGDIANAILVRQIQVVYQPKYDITSDTPVIRGAEALVRWNHPSYGLLFPGKFISLFEGNGMIQALDNYVWREAASKIKEWKDRFGAGFHVSVNVSRIDLQDKKVVYELCEIVKEAGIEPGDIHLEITESAYVSDVEGMIDTLNRFREKGFIIEMDDFGSGYSSLNMLTSLPIDVLKADMRFLSDIDENVKSEKMMELVTSIAGFLEIPITVEGVETKEQYDKIKALKCDMIQGYYLSKPVSAEAFEKLLKAQ